jgi:lipopolysaccharide biosynthesis glycosyltransferase
MSKKLFYILTAVLLCLICISLFFLWSKQKVIDTIKTETSINNNCPTKKAIVDITYITDSQYVPVTMVSMYSAIANKCPSTTYNFHIITENITSLDESRILKLKKLSPDTININIIPRYEPDLPFENMERFLQYKVGMHKIYLSEILTNLDKVIYMDGDTLVLKDLRDLYDFNVENVYASVVKDGIYYRFPKEMQEMGLDKRGFYFNSGVMLHNLKKQREDKVVDKLVEYIKTHKDFYGDQDVLNVVMDDKLKLMSYRYNCISTFFEADDLAFLSKYYNEELPSNTTDIYKKSSIIHYAGDKPWQSDYRPLYLKELWFEYLNKTEALL